MNTTLYKAIKYTDKAFGEDMEHNKRTLFWLLKLKPDADEALQIAAYGHDIERAFGLKESLSKIKRNKEGFLDKKMLEKHQIQGGLLMNKFITTIGGSSKLADRVKELISKHETGGNEEQNLLKDADSISYFETNAGYFVSKFAAIFGTKKIKQKLDWMYNRITSKYAKEIARPMYEKALIALAKYTKSKRKNLLLNQIPLKKPEFMSTKKNHTNYWDWKGKLIKFDIYITDDFSGLENVKQVYGLVLNKNLDEILIVLGQKKLWMLPGGGVENGESLIDTLVREIKEETNRDLDISTARPIYFQKAYRKNKSDKWIFNRIEARYAVIIKKDHEFVSDPDNESITRAQWVKITHLGKYLKWGDKTVNMIQNLLKIYRGKHTKPRI